MILKVIQAHKRPRLCQNHSSKFVYGLILIKNFMNSNIMKTHFFHFIIFDLKCILYYGEVLCFFSSHFKTFWPNYNFDLCSYGQLLCLFIYSIHKCIIANKEVQFCIENDCRKINLTPKVNSKYSS